MGGGDGDGGAALGYGDQTAALRRAGLDEHSIADRVLTAVRGLR